MAAKKISRRDFLKGMAAGAVGVASVGLFSACSATQSGADSPNSGAPADTRQAMTDLTASWLGAEPALSALTISEELTTEVLICGAGTGGLFAGAATVEKGLKTLIIEKNAMPGTVRDDIGAIGSRLQKEAGTQLDKEEVIHHHITYCSHRIDQRLARIWADESGAAVDWYENLFTERNAGKLWHEGGYDQMEFTGRYKKFATGHSPEYAPDMSGTKLVSEYFLEKGGEIRFETPFVRFVYEGRKVTGAIAKDKASDSYIKINATKGVILATGGYQQNNAMMNALQPDTTNLMPAIADGAVAGDGIKACLWMGAEMDDIHTSLLFDRCALKPDQTPATATESGMFWIGSQPFLKVNLNGERFANESTPYDYILHASSLQPGKCFVSIYDSKYTEDIARFQTVGCSRSIYTFPNGAPPNMPEPALNGMLGGLLENGFIQQADTIDELAAKLNLPVENLAATVNRYNELFDAQKDDDFFKEPYRLSSLRNPPYYGVRVCARLLSTLDGIRIDSYMRPLDKDCQPFEGLHIIGDASGSYYAHTYPNLFTGHAAGRTLTFARRVARLLAGEQV